MQGNTSSHTLTHTCIHAMHPSISAFSLEQRKLLYSLVLGYRDETAKTALWCCSLSFLSPFHSLFLNSNQTPGLSVPSICRNSLLTSAHSLASLAQGLVFLMWDVVTAAQTGSTPKVHSHTTHISLKQSVTLGFALPFWLD